MADDIILSVDSKEVSKAVDELIRMGKAAQDTGKAFEQGFRLVVQWQEKFKSTQARVNAELEKNVLKQNLANKAAKESAAVFKQHEDTLERLRHKYVEGHTAMELYSKEMNDLAVARKNNIISAKQQSEAVQKLNDDYAKGVGVFSKFNQAQLAATKGSNRMGVVTQQAGYQFSDFIVQVQSGTNPFVAFSQQASQLVGVLPLVAGNLGLTTSAAIALSAGLGIGIPLIGAIGAALWATSGKAKEATEVFDELSSAISDYASVSERLQNADFSENFGLFADQAERALAAIKELKQAEINESIRNVLGGNVERRSTGPTIQNIRAAADVLGVSGFSTSQEDKNLINEYLGLLESLQNAKGFDAQVIAADKLNKFIKANVDLTKLEGEQRKQITGLLELTVDLAEQAGKANKDANSHIEAYIKSQLKFIETKKKADEDVLDAQRKLGEEQVKLLQSQGKYAEATELAVKLAREEAEAKVLSSAENETQRRALANQATQAADLAEQAVRVAEQTRQTKEQTRMAKEEAQLLAKALREAASAMSALENIGIGVDRQLAVAEAKAKALSSGANETVAGTVAAERFKVETAFWEAFEKATSPQAQEEAIKNYESTLGKIDRLEQTLADNAAKREKIAAANKAATAAGKPNVSSLVESLLTEQDKVDAWREESLAKLQNFNALELEILGGHANAKFLIEREYEEKVRALKVAKTQQTTSAISGILTGFAGLMDSNNKKQFEQQKKFQIAAAVVDGYSAAVSAWDKGMKLGGPALAAAFTAGSLLKTGGLIKSISSAQYGGGAGGVSASGAAATVPAASAPSAQRVIVEGLDRNSLYSGEQLSNIFEALYKENKDRGFVFEVAR